MRLDFHTHGKLAKKLPFSTAYTDWLFGEARRAGLDALCLTEHFNTLQFADVYGYIASVSRRIGDTLELENGLRVFPGVETEVARGTNNRVRIYHMDGSDALHVRVYFEAPARWIAAQAASVLGALLLALCLAGMRGRRRPS